MKLKNCDFQSVFHSYFGASNTKINVNFDGNFFVSSVK